MFVQELQDSEPDTDEGPRAMALSFLSQTFVRHVSSVDF